MSKTIFETTMQEAEEIFKTSYDITIGLVTRGWSKEKVEEVLSDYDQIDKYLIINESLKAIDIYLTRNVDNISTIGEIYICKANINAMQVLIDLIKELEL